MMSPEEKELMRSYAKVLRDLEKDYRIAQVFIRGELHKKIIELKRIKKESADGQDQ